MSYWSIPKPVTDCCNTLRKAGYEAYPVGGCVRDLLLGRVPGDWDVTTAAKPEYVLDLFERTIPTGMKHGTITVICGDTAIEVTTFRKEGKYGDSRHPDHVTFDTDLAGDLSRRDFTINAMALGEDSQVIDPYGGRMDLDRKLIRAVGEPGKRFSEDALRILRGIRFAAQLGFEIERETATAMERCAGLTDKVAAQRIKVEVEKILCSPNPQWVSRVVELGVLDRFWNDWNKCDWNALKTAAPTPTERWAAFCSLTNFPITNLPVERAIKMAVIHPERVYVKKLSLSGEEMKKLGFQGEEIGRAQRKLAQHIQAHPEDNTPRRLKEILLNTKG